MGHHTDWGAASVGSTVLKPSHWGENADPDQDGIERPARYKSASP